VLTIVESEISPQTSCRKLVQIAQDMLQGYRGWTFGHHLGHGIGLGTHEAPRLNSHWDDAMQVGDVFTVEPGLYGEDLRAGLRIEQDYYLSPNGLKRLSNYPIGLA
jgi:Xaa-Pro dipeptidase